MRDIMRFQPHDEHPPKKKKIVKLVNSKLSNDKTQPEGRSFQFMRRTRNLLFCLKARSSQF